MEVSNSSACYHSTTRKTKYATAGIPEHWAIDTKERTVLILRNLQGKRYMFNKAFFKGRITIAAFPSIEMDLGDVFEGLPAS